MINEEPCFSSGFRALAAAAAAAVSHSEAAAAAADFRWAAGAAAADFRSEDSATADLADLADGRERSHRIWNQIEKTIGNIK